MVDPHKKKQLGIFFKNIQINSFYSVSFYGFALPGKSRISKNLVVVYNLGLSTKHYDKSLVLTAIILILMLTILFYNQL